MVRAAILLSLPAARLPSGGIRTIADSKICSGKRKIWLFGKFEILGQVDVAIVFRV